MNELARLYVSFLSYVFLAVVLAAAAAPAAVRPVVCLISVCLISASSRLVLMATMSTPMHKRNCRWCLTLN